MANVILMGNTCAGKTTLANKLASHGYERIVTYTTRPKRQGEIDKVDYSFVSDSEFDRMKEEGLFAETASYNTIFGEWKYGSLKADYEKKNMVAVLNVDGFEQIANANIPNLSVYFIEISYEEAKKRAMLRGDSIEEFDRRFEADRNDIEKARKLGAEIVITENIPELERKLLLLSK